MILNDPYAGHRKYWRRNWKPKVPRDTQWTDWDYRLAYAVQIIDDFTDNESGQFIPYDQSADVAWVVEEHRSGYLESIEKYTKGKELQPGIRVGAYPVFREDVDRPTITSYLEDLEEGSIGLPSDYDQPKGRPPTAEEMAALRALKNGDTVD